MTTVTQIITTDVESHAAVRSWLALPVHPDGFVPTRPEWLELLHQSDKSSIYRLPGVGREAGAVIAKHCRVPGALVEHEVYTLLKSLSCPSLHYYGCVEGCSLEADKEERRWLFVEDAAGEPFDPRRTEHRRLAARWLASLHTSSARLRSVKLPERGPRHYLEHLRAGRAVLRRGQERRVLSASDRDVLDDVYRMLDHVESHWSKVEKISEEMPWALVHADFVKKNVRVRDGDSSTARLLAFDWEVSGWGLPAVDLGKVDLDVYHACVHPWWPQLTRETLERLAHVGTLTRGGTASVHWEATSLETGWLDNIIGNLRLYAERMAAACTFLGWPP